MSIVGDDPVMPVVTSKRIETCLICEIASVSMTASVPPVGVVVAAVAPLVIAIDVLAMISLA